MFGQQNQQDKPQDANIPEQSIEGALGDQPNSVAPTSPTWQHPGTPIADSASKPVADPVTPSDDSTQDVTAAPSEPEADSPHDLIDIKQQALHQLAPLVGHLDQSPEEKFRTTMMMIQASDDQSLVQDAYTAAQKITDEKVRAQALLDIVNEINYFTQQHGE